MWLRQIKRYLRSKSRIIGSLAQPLLFLTALGFGFGPVYAKAGGGNYLQFIAPGVIAMSILFTSIFSGIEIIWDRQFGFLKETLVAPVSRFHIVLGRVLGGATVASIQGMVVLVLTTLFGFRPNNWLMIIPTIIVMLLIATIFSAFGTAIACVLEDMQGFQLIMNFIVMPTFFFSGALFPLSGLPPILGFVARIDPLTYGVDALRGVLASANHINMALNLSIISGMMIVLLLTASYLFSKMEV
jgi:ABC-2 type transport system permease protein